MATEITREELELCAELLGYSGMGVERFMRERNAADREELAKAAKLTVDFEYNTVITPHIESADGLVAPIGMAWPQDGTYEECVVKAAAAVMRARKQV